MTSAINATPAILVLYAHASPRHSRANHRLAQAASALPHVQVHDLYETYPDFDIDVRHEQALLAAADLVVFQHPIQWYGMPSLLKEWVDVVLEEGWAYGAHGHALRDKDFWLVASTGGAHESYHADGQHGHPFAAFLPPFQQTAQLCGMRWLTPHILHDAQRADEASITAHVAHYVHMLQTYPHWAATASAD